ncbi:tripartite tricarboxylate transporter substrate binding protein [Alcaligenaceae bacterium]|nr:tripartite tricarboxylate transporter substrate binding protein [Alcaligenaceae bacterium]
MSINQIINKSRRGFNGFIFGLAALGTFPVMAQQFPTKPITIIVPYAPGGPTDTSARGLAEGMSKALGVPIIVNNRPSAGGLVAASFVTKAPKDGYTLLLSVGTIVSTNPHLYKELPYKVSDLTPISQYARWPYVISASPMLPANTVAELIAYAKTKPEGLAFGTVGLGTQSHIIAAWLAQRFDIKVELVPYKGVSQAVADLSSGRVDLLTDGVSTAVTNHKAGLTKIIASMGYDRFFMPDGVKTFAESGYPDLIANSDFGLMAPTGTPEPVIQVLYQAMAKALGSPELQQQMKQRGENPLLSASPEAYGTYIQEETVRWGKLIKSLSLQIDPL